MIRALLRQAVTAIRGRTPCQMSMCGRPARNYGLCSRHIHGYQYTP